METNKPERTPLRRAIDKLIADGKLNSDSHLADLMKMSKGTVSTYIKEKPGKKFLKEFEEMFDIKVSEFEEKSNNVPHGTPQPNLSSNENTDIIKLIAISLDQQKQIDYLREQNRQDEIATRSKEADNVTRLIALLEQKTNSELQLASKNETIQNAKLYALEGYVVELGSLLRKTTLAGESEVLGKIEGEYYKANENTGKTPAKSVRIPNKQKG